MTSRTIMFPGRARGGGGAVADSPTGLPRTSDAAAEPLTVDAFVASRGRALLRLAWFLTGDADAAQDLVQDAMVRVLPRWDRVVEGGDPEGYVRNAVRTAWIDSWRRRRSRDAAAAAWGLDDDRPAADDADGAATRLDLAGALARLTPRQRTVLVLRFYEDLTEVQTAEAMGCSVSTVKSQARHALDRLKALAPDLVGWAASAGPDGQDDDENEVQR